MIEKVDTYWLDRALELQMEVIKLQTELDAANDTIEELRRQAKQRIEAYAELQLKSSLSKLDK